MKTAIIYVRVSSGKQAKRELPLESQMHECRRAARELGATILKEFIEPGRSAYHDHRIEFEQAIQYCEKNGPNFFITWDTERFSRRVSAGYRAEERLETVGVEIIYAGFDAGEDPDSRFLNVGIRRIMGEMQSRSNARNTRRSMILNARRGHFNGGRAPFGYVIVPDGKRKKLEISLEEAEVVRQIFDLKLQGLGAKSIAVLLNSQKTPNKGKPWQKNMIIGVLKSDAVRGYQIYNRGQKNGRARPQEEWISVQSHDAIIQQEAFDRIQQMMARDTRQYDHGSPHSKHLFTGLLECGSCGGSIQIQTATGRGGKKYSYYNCRENTQNGGCAPRRIRVENVDTTLRDEILKRLLADHNLQRLLQQMNAAAMGWASHASQRRTHLNKLKNDYTGKNERLLSAIERGGCDDLSVVIQRLNEHRDKIAGIDVELAAIAKQPEPRPILITESEINRLRKYLYSMISEMAVKNARDFLSSIVHRVVMKDEEAIVYYRAAAIFSTQRFAADVVWLPVQDPLRTISIPLPPELRRKAA